ncbi:hypothetical protein [Nonomuraea jiangxiensis]|uniref:WD40-like Beta Propeller Repeat n=1 Tax=Nonomuraea jiangxiensis TaxID=633440 RepID=A0A1G8GZB9_9ACTN|nr:hypothetical protein [Nonomuraea jiangxiensis]SDH99748.1 hypothetical protein SAMN05421869_1042 [Nonomuraea jiangxiensis]
MPTQPGPRRGTGWIVAAGVAGVLVLVAATAFVALRLAGRSGATTPPTSSAAVSNTPTPVSTATRISSPAPTSRTITLPGTSVKVIERAGDPLRLTSYTVNSGKRLYVRKHATGAFAQNSRYFDYVLNLRTNQALGTDVDYSSDFFSTVSVVDHSTGDKRVVKISRRPVYPTTPRWSPDGAYGLVTLYKGTAAGDTDEYGYAIIDVAAGTARAFEIKEQGAGEWRFFWDAGGRAVGTWVAGRMKFYDLNGKHLRTLSDVGSPVWVEGDDVSPSGSRFLALCTTEGTSLCARSTSGDDPAPITVPVAGKRLIGWWDDDHLAVWRAEGAGYEAVVTDLSGQVRRVLATAPRKAEFDRMGFRFSRTG